jgi:hypothetical protein
MIDDPGATGMRIGTAIVVAAAILAVGSVSTATILTLGGTRLGQPKPSASASPTAKASPTATISDPYPPARIDPSLNFAGGDFVTGTGFTDCQMHVNFAATSRRDGTGASGRFVATVINTDNCEGQATGQVACLLVNGNHATFDGWMDQRTGVFSGGTMMMAVVTENDPQTYGPPVDRAGFGIAGGGPECPPPITGTGPQVKSGTVIVAQAR